MELKVGCSGFPVSHRKYYEEFGVVELQSTFYRLPSEKTVLSWRKEAPPRFEFTVKAWQAITHPLSSPTWRKVKLQSAIKDRSKYGFLQPTKQNFEAWAATLAVCRSLRSTACVVQCPPQFSFTDRHARYAKEFFANIERDGLKIVWEPRGDWVNKSQEIQKICEKLEVIHCVDPLRMKPAPLGQTGYFRLHGLGGGNVNYSYRYTDRDLSLLSEEIFSLSQSKLEEVYVMFNNVTMFYDARRFKDSWALTE